jgi:LacI family transcriptional regulator, repressor for deo operon, udp, cdd, tsx, nupC, and nupG
MARQKVMDVRRPFAAMHKTVRKPRIGDVAARAGVSTATVSRTLATPDRVTPKTREAVMKAVRETGYVLNIAARNLRTSRSHAVLAVLPDASNTFFSQVLRGISDTLHQHGYSLVIADTANDPARERDHAEFIRGGRVDGVLLLNGRLLPSPAGKRGHAVPTVSLCERIPGSRLPHVETANREAARAMTEHLLTLGHRRIGYLCGPPANILEHDRFAGYGDALAAAGIALDPQLVLAGDFTIAAGEAAAGTYLALARLPDAVFACNDAMAMGLIRGFTAAGVAVPAEISIAGFDDIEFAAAYNPALTTVRQSRGEIGARAAAMLVDLMQGNKVASREIRLSAEVVMRDSTRAISAAAALRRNR